MKGKGLLIAGAIAAGVWFLSKAYNGFWQKIQFSFNGIKFGGIGADFKSIIINPSMMVKNENAFPIPVTGFTGYIYFQGQPFVPIRSLSNAPIAANTSTRLEYSLTIEWEHLKQLGENWKDVLKLGNFRMAGNIQVTVSNVIYQFPINEPFSIEI